MGSRLGWRSSALKGSPRSLMHPLLLQVWGGQLKFTVCDLLKSCGGACGRWPSAKEGRYFGAACLDYESVSTSHVIAVLAGLQRTSVGQVDGPGSWKHGMRVEIMASAKPTKKQMEAGVHEKDSNARRAQMHMGTQICL